MKTPRIALACVLAGLLSSTAIVACGDDAKESASTPAADAVPTGALPPNILTERDVASQPKDSPARTLLEWGQAIQFSDADGVAALSTSEAVANMGGRARLNKAIGFMGSGFSRITIAGVDETDENNARVRAWLSTYDSTGKRTALTPATFSFAKVNGDWKVENLSLVARTLRDYEALERNQQ